MDPQVIFVISHDQVFQEEENNGKKLNPEQEIVVKLDGHGADRIKRKNLKLIIMKKAASFISHLHGLVCHEKNRSLNEIYGENDTVPCQS